MLIVINVVNYCVIFFSFFVSALTLLVGQPEGYPGSRTPADIIQCQSEVISEKEKKIDCSSNSSSSSNNYYNNDNCDSNTVLINM